MDYNLFSATLKNLKNAFISRGFLYIKTPLENEICSLMPWSEINRILWQVRLGSPRIRIHKDGETIPENLYTKHMNLRRGSTYVRIEENNFYKALREGGTLVIDAIEELYTPLNNFIYFLERFFQEQIQANCYMSWGETRGFSTHWDDHDVIIIQIHGRKRWYIFEETRKYPMYKDIHIQHEPPTNPSWNQIIEQGDILFIPRGYWHHANALNEPSLHLTLGFRSKTGISFMQWLQEKLTDKEIFREELPRFGLEEDLKVHDKKIKEELLRVLNEVTLSNYINESSLRLEKRTLYSLPWAITEKVIPDDNNFIIALNVALITNFQEDENKKTIKFSANYKNYEFDIKCSSLFKHLMNYKWHKFSELTEKLKSILPENVFRDLLKELVLQGLLAISKDEC